MHESRKMLYLLQKLAKLKFAPLATQFTVNRASPMTSYGFANNDQK